MVEDDDDDEEEDDDDDEDDDKDDDEGKLVNKIRVIEAVLMTYPLSFLHLAKA